MRFRLSLVLGLLVACAPSISWAQGFEQSLMGGANPWIVMNEAEVQFAGENLIRLKAGNGWLRSFHKYRDFVLALEWKALKAAEYDAGIYVRTLTEGAPFPKGAYQINLLDGAEGNIRGLPGAESKGLIRRGEWNRFEITVKADTVALVINGKPAWNSKGIKTKVGYVGLQCEVPKGGEFEFRNIKITELSHTSLFNGKDLTGWSSGETAPADACWKVEEGDLVCTGAKGPWLRSDKEYGDFNLRCDYLIHTGGNSGWYVRVPKDGNHHRENDSLPEAGFEVQILDDAAPQHANLKDYQYGGSLYDIAGANPRVTRTGQWNSLEIDCKGQKVSIVHNGKEVVSVTEESHPLIKLRKTSGYLGLQNHSTEVRFRNLRVGPSLQP